MKKHATIHFHRLLWEMKRYLEHNGVDIPDEEYEEMGVKPTSIHVSKTGHKAAVFALAGSIAEEVSGPQLTFSEEDLLQGRLKPMTEDESILAQIFYNFSKSEPQKITNHVPILISFIQNGDITTQKYATKSVMNLSSTHPEVIQSFSNELMRSSGEIYERNVRRDLRSAIKSG